jgi:DNA replication protein DnaC
LCEKCAVRTIAYNRYYEANIPIEYWHLSMDKHFKGSKTLLEKFQTLTNDLGNTYKQGSSICFAGPHGVGKSFTSCSILKKACLKNYNCLYTTLSDMISALTNNDERHIARKELNICDFLVIDELDFRFMKTASAADFFGISLENVFRNRSQNKLPTIMCSNSPNPLEAFNGEIKQSIESIMAKVEIVSIFGNDFRKEGK